MSTLCGNYGVQTPRPIVNCSVDGFLVQIVESFDDCLLQWLDRAVRLRVRHTFDYAPDWVVERIQVWRRGRPLVFVDEIRKILVQPPLRRNFELVRILISARVRRSSILLKRPVVPKACKWIDWPETILKAYRLRPLHNAVRSNARPAPKFLRDRRPCRS